jgi:hypothetical protein
LLYFILSGLSPTTRVSFPENIKTGSILWGGLGFGVSQLLLTLIKTLSAIRILVCEAEGKRPLLCHKSMQSNINEIFLIEIVVKIWNGWNWSLEPSLQKM